MVFKHKHKLGKVPGGITGALLASTLYLGTTASADSTPQTTTVQTATTVQNPSADTETQNTGGLSITTEADSAKPTQQTSVAAQSASPAVSASDRNQTACFQQVLLLPVLLIMGKQSAKVPLSTINKTMMIATILIFWLQV